MNPEYKYITLVFENCNTVKIMPEHILSFFIKDISYSLWSNGSQYNSFKQCKFFNIWLDNASLINKTCFEEDYGGDETNNFLFHLKYYHDITHIEVVGLDDTKEYIQVPWGYSDEYKNSLESVEWNENDFIITIGEK
jgi:hypothetical protein